LPISLLKTFRSAGLRSVLAAVILWAPMAGHATDFGSVYPQAGCAEYPTDTSHNTWIAHFSYVNLGTSVITFPSGVPQNYFIPGPTYSNQVQIFQPGYWPDANIIPVNYLYSSPLVTQLSWLLLHGSGTDSTATLNILSYTGGNPVYTPTCTPAFAPQTLTFTQPGIYTHQYLGQVNAGPTSGTPVALSSDPNIVISNVTYVPTDGANPSGTINPNSIYGDITVAGSGGSATLLVQLLSNNVSVTDAAVTVTY
jgi:hypothetical protein